MALNPPSPFRVRPLPVTLVSGVAVALFVVVVAVTARLTADGVVMPRTEADAGVDPGDGGVGRTDAGVEIADGGAPDAGVEVVTVEEGPDAGPEPDGGPPGAEPAPYDPAVVAAAAVVVVERCAEDALRWDPSLGGPFTLRVELPASDDGDDAAAGASAGPAPRILVIGMASPVLEACLQRRGPRMERAPGTRLLTVSQAVVARGVLRADGAVEVADPAIVALPAPAPGNRSRR